jgi:hypothetical protein
MPGVPWKEIIGFRIVVDHAYHRLDYGRVWNTLSQDIPRLRAAIDRLLAAIDEDDETSAEALAGMISREGRVVAWRLATDERVIYEGEIQVDYDGTLVNGWKPVGRPRI